MYERAFDVGWESLSAEEAVERMYALGIATELGHEFPEERKRLRGLASTAYERSVLDLAFEEGRREVRDVRPNHETDEGAWEELIEAADSPAPARESLSVDPSTDVPEVVDRPGALDGFDIDELGRLRFPSLLKRDEE
ncbi:hypothetical protein [Halobellus rubicundus]|uniref:Uncharacterized protein n=1 Tax=Halobellus rubicundus TaxID=2996466 RepID=A0ABD5MFY2_9EURY